MGELLQPWHLMVLLLSCLPFAAVIVAPFWMIFKKAGFQPVLSFLMLVPIINLVMLYVIAFSKWKGNASLVA